MFHSSPTTGGLVALSHPHQPQTAPRADQGLYDPSREHDACGVAFVADLHGRRSHDVVAKGLAALCRLDHRGARGAETNTGDGAGIMIQIPDEFLRAAVDFALPPAGQYATGLVFLPDDDAGEARARQVLEKYALVEGADLLGWRDVPVDAERPRGHGAGRAAPGAAGLPRRAPAHRRARRPGRGARWPGWSWSGSPSACASRPSGRPPSGACRRTSRRCRRGPSSTRGCSPRTSCRPSSRT